MWNTHKRAMNDWSAFEAWAAEMRGYVWGLRGQLQPALEGAELESETNGDFQANGNDIRWGKLFKKKLL